jgi:hypothetical protein
MSVRVRLFLYLLLLVTSLLSLAPRRAPGGANGPVSTRNDSRLFRDTVEQLRDGRPYHQTMHDLMVQRHYPTASVFNWRQPAWYYVLMIPGSRWLLVLLVCGCIVAWHIHLKGTRINAVLGVFLLNTLIAANATSAAHFTEPVAGVLIGFSLLAYTRKEWASGAAWALAALFIRELAAPYVVACGLLALWHRRTREVVTWSVGGTLYLLYFWWHYRMAMSFWTPDALSQTQWVQLGGLQFVLETVSRGLILWALPKWVTAFAFVLLVAGLTSSRTPAYVRICTAVYLLTFAIVGQPFNSYWGWIPLFAYSLTMYNGALELHQTVMGTRKEPREPVSTLVNA